MAGWFRSETSEPLDWLGNWCQRASFALPSRLTFCFLLAVNVVATILLVVKVENYNYTPQMADPGSPAFQTFETHFAQQVRRRRLCASRYALHSIELGQL